MLAAAIGNPSSSNGWNTTGAVTVTASTSHASRPALRTIDGSGLDAATGLLHQGPQGALPMTGDTMWLSKSATLTTQRGGTVAGSHWIEFAFDRSYALDEMWIWNYNEIHNSFNWLIFGMKNVTIEVSPTGSANPAAWTTVFDGQIPLSNPGLSPGYAAPASLVVDLGGVNAQYVVITTDAGPNQNWSNGQFDQAGLSEVRFFADSVASDWQSAEFRTTLTSSTVQGKFQAGMLYELTQLSTGKKLIASSPNALAASVPIFGQTSVNLSQAQVDHVVTPTSVQTTHRWANGVAWQVNWSVDGTDLVLQTSAQSPQNVELFSFFIAGTDVVNYRVAAINVNGTAHASQGGFQGPLIPAGADRTSAPQSHVQPLIALFEGNGDGFFVEGRDLTIGPSNLRPFGAGSTAELMMSRTLKHLPTQTPQLYEVRVRAYHGFWQDAVDPYIAWMESGLGFLPLDEKPQAWVKNIRNQVYITPGDYTTLNNFARQFNTAETYVGRQAEYRHFGFDVGYPDYSVSPTAASWIARARNLGFHVGVHVNVGGIDRSNTSLIEQMRPALAQTGTDAMGKPIYDGTSTFVYASAAYEPWRNYLVAALAGVVAAGADVIYLDQTNGVLGKFLVNGMTGIEGVMRLEQAIQAAYPHVAIQTEQFNPMAARHASFALTTLDLGHPLSGYLFSHFIKIVPEGVFYAPVDLPTLDAFAQWGHFTPGAGGHESWRQIALAFQAYDLSPNSRLPRGPHQISGFDGPGGVTAFFEKSANTRSFVVYQPNQNPRVFGLRYTNVTEIVQPTGGLADWFLYDDVSIKGLDPNVTYFLDPAVSMDPNRFHVKNIPADYRGYTNDSRLIVTQELGFHDHWFRLTFSGHGAMDLVVPDNYDVYLDGQQVTIDRVHNSATVTVSAQPNNPSELLAFLNSGSESAALSGIMANLPWHLAKHRANRGIFDNASTLFLPSGFYSVVAGAGVWFGQFPAASQIRIRGAYQMRSANWMGAIGDAVIRINGNDVLRLDAGNGPPFPRLSFDVDVTQFQGRDALIELIADGNRTSADAADWIAPEIVVVPLVPPLPGDYDRNGVVAASDFTLWTSTWGSTQQLAADGNGNGVVDGGDFLVWQMQFGASAGGAVTARDSAGVSGGGNAAASAAPSAPRSLAASAEPVNGPLFVSARKRAFERLPAPFRQDFSPASPAALLTAIDRAFAAWRPRARARLANGQVASLGPQASPSAADRGAMIGADL